MNKINNRFNFNIFHIFRNRYIKIFPNENIGNRQRSQTEYNISNYKDILQTEFNNKIINKNNKKINPLRIRGSSF